MKALLSVLLFIAAAYATFPAATQVWLDQSFDVTWVLPVDSYDLYDATNTLAGTYYDTQIFKVWINESVPGFDVTLVGISGSNPTGLTASYDFVRVYGRTYTPACGYPEYSVELDSSYPCEYYNWQEDYFYVGDTSTDYTLWTFDNDNNYADWNVGNWYYIRVDGEARTSPYVGSVTVTLKLVSSANSCPSPQVPYGYDYSGYTYCGPAPMWINPATGNYWAWNVTDSGNRLYAINTTNMMVGSITVTVNITNQMGVNSDFVLRARGNAIPSYEIYCDYNYLSVDAAGWAFATITCANIQPGTFYFEIGTYYDDYVSYLTTYNGTINLWVSWQNCNSGWAGLMCDEPVYELGYDTNLSMNKTIMWNSGSRYMSHHYWVNISSAQAQNLEFDPVTFYFTEYSGNIYVYVRSLAPSCDANSDSCYYSDLFDTTYNYAIGVYTYYVHLYEADFAAGNVMYFITVSCESSSYNCTYGMSRTLPVPLPTTTTSGSSSSVSSSTGTTTTGSSSSSSSSSSGTTTTGMMGTTTTGMMGTTTTGMMGTTTTATPTSGTTTSRMTTTTAKGTTTGMGTTSAKATTGSASSVAASGFLLLVAAFALLL